MSRGSLTELWTHRGLLWKMTVRDFRSRYAGSLLGVFWTVINPLLLLAVFSFIGIAVVKVKFGERAGIDVLYIFCGILPWLAFQDGAARSGTVILENKNLVTRARFPLPVLPAYPPVSALLGQISGMTVMTLAALIFGQGPGWSILVLPILFMLQLVFTVGLSMLVSSLSAYVRDVAHILPVILLAWMFATPIFYRAESLPGKFARIINLNPLAALITSYRQVLIEGAWPEPESLAVAAVWAVVSLAAGGLIYGRLSRGFADRL